MKKKDMTKEEMARAGRRAYAKKWREKNREHIREYNRNWKKENPDKVKEYQKNYYAKLFEKLYGNG